MSSRGRVREHFSGSQKKEEGDVRGSWGQDRRYGVVEEELGVQSPGPGDR